MSEICYACKQTLPKEYKHNLSKGLIETFHIFAAKSHIERRSLHPVKDCGLDYNQASNFQKLKYFDLVEKDEKNAGYWNITKTGVMFLTGREAVPSRVFTQNGKVTGTEGLMKIHDHPDIEEYWQQVFI